MRETTPTDLTDYRPDGDLLQGRVILVTGAGDGLGRAAALAFAAHGASLVLVGKTASKLEVVYDTIEQRGDPQAAIFPMDLETAMEKDHLALADALNTEFGRLDGVLHNAAILGELCPLARYDLRLWGQVMQINVHAPLLLTRSCLALLKRAPDASIVFTADRVGRNARAYWGAYAISKSATDGMMQVFADELETNTSVRVNAIDPGPTRTRLRRLAFPAEDTLQHPLPEKLMAAYLYLMGPDSRGSNGRIVCAQAC